MGDTKEISLRNDGPDGLTMPNKADRGRGGIVALGILVYIEGGRACFLMIH
jgi:hypothetical protein